MSKRRMSLGADESGNVLILRGFLVYRSKMSININIAVSTNKAMYIPYVFQANNSK
jgi:hypothetical protein